MSSYPHPLIKIEITVDADDPQVLEGLDAWLKLGLISSEELTLFCRESLSCRLPKIPKVIPVIPQNQGEKSPNLQPVFTPENIPQKTPNFITQTLQSIMAELSVVWLLFLGLFLVIISSAVLAARQWENFSPVSQYGVLFFYTLTFFGISLWTEKNQHLRLTTQTLKLVSLLLIPVNFWAIDSFRFPHIILMLIPAIFLMGITQHLWRSSSLSLLPLINYIILSYCQWGWNFHLLPQVMIYLGILTTFCLKVYPVIQRKSSPLLSPNKPSSKPDLFIFYGLLLLLIRGIFLQLIPLSQLGLALGIIGIILLYLESNSFWEKIIQQADLCLILLILGWLVSVREYPLQAMGVTVLAFGFFISQLHQFWKITDLLFLEVLGLQSFWLMWRLIPPHFQENIVHFLVIHTHTENFPPSLLGVLLFPYILILVIINNILEKKQQHHLVRVNENITLIGGTLLTLLTLNNPLLINLNLGCSTLTLGWVSYHKITTALAENLETPDQAFLSTFKTTYQPLINTTHILGLLTIYSGIYYIFPHLSFQKWTLISLSLMVIEWGILILIQRSSLKAKIAWIHIEESNFYLGVSLSLISLFFLKLTHNLSPFCLWGFLIPFSLSTLGILTQNPYRQLSSHLSLITLGFVNLFVANSPEFHLINFSISSILMLVNTRLVIKNYMAIITLGFILLWEIKLIDQVVWGIKSYHPSLELWLIINTLNLWGLELFKSILGRFSPNSHPHKTLQQTYRKASHQWGIFLTILLLTLLTLHAYILYNSIPFITFPTSPLTPLAIIILIGAITYRNYPTFSPWGIYGIAWGLELLTAEILALGNFPTLVLSVTNILLGLLIQWLGNYWEKYRAKQNLTPLPSLKIVPLIFGGLGGLFRAQNATSWTGLITLGISLIFINLGRSEKGSKPLIFVGLLGISASLYEIVIYQLIHRSTGGSFGDGLVILAGLGTSILCAYQILSPWLVHFLNIPIGDLKKISHFHWGFSSFLLILAGFNPLSSGLFIGLGVGLILVQYAISMGRRHPLPSTGEIWVYIGFLEAFAIRIYWITSPVAQVLNGPLLLWKTAIASLFSFILSLLPWENWGWSKRPWNFLVVTIPLIAILESRGNFHPLSFFITAGFYVFISRKYQQIRWTYITVILINWIFLHWLIEINQLQSAWITSLLALSWLYIVQVEPHWKGARITRHQLRLVGILTWGSILIFSQQGLLTSLLSFLILFLGISQKIRAFLYGGTIIFMLNAFYQLIVLSFEYPFIKAVIGLAFGVLLIAIAGNFETRRIPLLKTLQNWFSQLETWE